MSNLNYYSYRVLGEYATETETSWNCYKLLKLE